MFTSRVRVLVTTLAIAEGAAVGAAGIARAASNATSAQTQSGVQAPAQAGAPDPAKMSHGPGETLLTGSAADKAKAAALAAVPGAKVIRVETDSGGAQYEAHLTKADGSEVTVKLDSSFKVTATESGFGSGPGH
jgi:uncharacterized membrane protein YkoI